MMKHKKVAFATLGCKLNHYDTEAIRETFETEGYEAIPFTGDADVYVINTCTVTGATDHQCRQLIRRAVKRKNHGRNVKIVVTGCYAQTDAKEITRLVDGVDLIAGNNEKDKIAEFLRSECHPDSTQYHISDIFAERKIRTLPINRFADYTRAYLRIQEGCNRRCSYCIIPYARGKSRSETPENVITQAQRLADKGYREIVLTGTHIGMYGIDLDKKITLHSLLYALHDITGIHRLRLSSIDPLEFTPELIEAATTLPKICRHFHISLQSGDDAILCAMRRPYTTRRFSTLFDSILERAPDAAIGTDLIVGFPGEDDESSQRTENFLCALPITYMHIFPFSPRKGTPAANMTPVVPEKTKKERCRRLMQLRTEKITAFRSRFLHKELEILVENRRWKNTEFLTGLSGNYIRAFFYGEDSMFGSFVKFIPEKIVDDGMEGRYT
ncbi:MAG: tRNA (N(6)-L-threonylcarbamoyladenosine(37)-C(2))-methylthiotransferase MtaB [bacterium]